MLLKRSWFLRNYGDKSISPKSIYTNLLLVEKRKSKIDGKALAIVQARMGSTRLPGKMMLEIAGQPLLKLIFDRLKRSKAIDKLVLATSINPENDSLAILAGNESIEFYRGSENDVLDRFYQVSQIYKNYVFIIRVCGDNPLIDPLEVDRLASFHKNAVYDYSFNHIPHNDNGYPDGVGAEIVPRNIVKQIWEKAHQPHQREHCFDYIWDNKDEFKIGLLKAPQSIRRPDVKLDVDTADDIEFIRTMLRQLDYYQIVHLTTEEIIRAYDRKEKGI